LDHFQFIGAPNGQHEDEVAPHREEHLGRRQDEGLMP
jgi:hypothetical protein